MHQAVALFMSKLHSAKDVAAQLGLAAGGFDKETYVNRVCSKLNISPASVVEDKLCSLHNFVFLDYITPELLVQFDAANKCLIP